jgi:hypothetical protein
MYLADSSTTFKQPWSRCNLSYMRQESEPESLPPGPLEEPYWRPALQMWPVQFKICHEVQPPETHAAETSEGETVWMFNMSEGILHETESTYSFGYSYEQTVNLRPHANQICIRRRTTSTDYDLILIQLFYHRFWWPPPMQSRNNDGATGGGGGGLCNPMQVLIRTGLFKQLFSLTWR